MNTTRHLIGRARLLAAALATLLLSVSLACAAVQPAAQPAAAPSGAGKTEQQPAAQASSYARPELLVETDWLAKNLSDPKLRIVDLRAADKYQAGHIPGSVSLNSNQLDQMYGTVQNVAPPEKVAEVVGNLGISNDTKVVLYDDNNTLTAGRVFWVLDYNGHPSVSVLNGGFPKWDAEKRETTRQAPKIEPAKFVAKLDPTKIADEEYVKASIGKSSVSLCDARTPNEYAGTDVRSARGGAIPGAKNVNWELNVTKEATPQMKLAADLKKLYADAGVSPDQEVITYCQTGVRAAQTYFTLKLIGYTKVRNYDGSWQEWGNDASAPIEKKG